MKVRPVLFSAPMIRALLYGRKTQTRRIVKPQPIPSFENPPRFSDIEEGDLFICPDILPTSDQRGMVITECTGLGVYHSMGQRAFVEKHCPYGQPGDTLWCRETFARNGIRDGEKVFYRADGESQFMGEMRESNGNITRYHTDHWERNGEKRKGADWKPSIHMPRWASRLTLELTEIWVERLLDISEADAIAEGIEPVFTKAGEQCGWLNYEHSGDGVGYCTNPVDSYASLWRTINGPSSWAANPFVWCLSFCTHKRNVDTLPAERGAHG